ncbi:MAG: hypothetical protein IPM66_23315 [Acidobacteriota bacterium]|nr:MAG: hypothetical protein IPM66_23315 [Acidobacteriota bacterium]
MTIKLSKITISSMWLRAAIVLVIILLSKYYATKFPSYVPGADMAIHYGSWLVRHTTLLILSALLVLIATFLKGKLQLLLCAIGIYGLTYVFIDWYITSYNAISLPGLGTGYEWTFGLVQASWEHVAALILTIVLLFVYFLELKRIILASTKNRKLS